MAGALRKTMLYLGLAEDEHAVDDDEQYVLGDDELEANMHDYDEPRATPIRRSSNVRQIQQGASELRRITTVHPRSYNDARVIGEAFRAGTPVIMNLSEMDDNDAKRLVDFSAGIIFGLHGSIERVTNKVFLLSPAYVEVTGEDQEANARGGFYNQS